MFDNVAPFRSPGYYIREASQDWELQGAADLRKQVFVREQCVFPHHDRDPIDDQAAHLVVLSTCAHELDAVVGTVRIHQPQLRIWWGSRLAVSADYRKVGQLGAELIRLAVSSANAQGCDKFFAHVQVQNVDLFRRMRWHPLEEVPLHGVPHMRMMADLDYYPPMADAKLGWYHKPQKIAA